MRKNLINYDTYTSYLLFQSNCHQLKKKNPMKFVKFTLFSTFIVKTKIRMGNNHSLNSVNVVTFKEFLVIVYNCGAHFFVFWLECLIYLYLMKIIPMFGFKHSYYLLFFFLSHLIVFFSYPFPALFWVNWIFLYILLIPLIDFWLYLFVLFT